MGNEAAAGDRAGHGGGGVALDRTEALGARMRTIDEEENEWKRQGQEPPALPLCARQGV